MAVNLNVISAPKLLEVLGLSDQMAKLKAYGLEIKVETGAITITHPDHPPIKASVPVKAGSLLSLAGGSASPVLKEGVAHSLTNAIKVAIEKAGDLGTLDNKPAAKDDADDIEFGFNNDKPKKMQGAVETDTDESSMSSLLKKAKPADKSMAQILDDAVNTASPTKPVKKASPDGPAVPLASAELMYQPVKGTSPGSTYFVVAMTDGLNIAARWKGGSLSVRAEGPKISKYQAQLKEAEMSVNSGYASVHLDVGTGHKLAARALAAVLASMNVDWDTPMPQISYCKG